MAISSIGVQTIQPGSGMSGGSPPPPPPESEPNDDKIAETAPTQSAPASGTGQFVDKTV